jgi:hypothetical protein
VPSGGWSHPGDGNYKDHCKGEEETQGGKKWTGKGKVPNDGMRDKKGYGKGKGKGNGQG